MKRPVGGERIALNAINQPASPRSPGTVDTIENQVSYFLA